MDTPEFPFENQHLSSDPLKAEPECLQLGPGATYGSLLNGYRERSGLTVDQLSSQTRISAAYIASLESEDLSQLPGLVFARGFAGSICKNLGCSEFEKKRVLECFDSETSPHREGNAGLRNTNKETKLTKSAGFAKILMSDEATLKASSRSVFRSLPSVVFVLTLVFGMAYWLWPEGRQSEPVQEVVSQARPPAGIEAEKAQASVTQVHTSPLERNLEEPATDAEDLKKKDPLKKAEGDLALESGRPQARKAIAGGTAASGGPHSLTYTEVDTVELNLAKPVRIRLRKDNSLWKTRTFSMGYTKFDFDSKLDLLVFDSGAVDLKVNGEWLGPLGEPLKVSRVSFLRP